jgi:hypothetical protein
MFKILLRNIIRKAFNHITNIKWDSKIISKDKVDYILALNDIYNEAKEIPGHIIELGTGRGRNAVIFGSLIKKNQQEKFKKYFGFDTFQSYTSDDIKTSKHLVKQRIESMDSYENIQEFIRSNNLEKIVTLIRGDIIQTLPNFLENKEGLFGFNKLLISLVYIDCNSYRAASFALNKIKGYLASNALILVDECTLGDETKALKDFCNENGLELKSTYFKNHISSYSHFIK